MSKRILLFVFGLVCIILLQQSTVEASIHCVATNDNSEINSQNQSDAEYRIKPKDVLLIRIYGVCTLTSDFKVNDNGILHMSIIGDVHTAGKTTSEFEIVVIEKLKKYLKNPKVQIRIMEKSSQ